MEKQLIEKLKDYVRYLKRAIHSESIIDNITAGVRDQYDAEIASLDKQIAESETHVPEGYFEKKPTERYLGELPDKHIADSKEIPAGAEEKKCSLPKEIVIIAVKNMKQTSETQKEGGDCVVQNHVLHRKGRS